MSTNLLKAQGLRFGYPGRPTLLSGIDLQVAPREVVVLLGGSGCGKSTLLKTLAGLQRPSAGTVAFDSKALDGPHPQMGMLFQQASLLPWLRVAANVGFGLRFKRQPKLSSAEQQQRIAHALAAVGLPQAHTLWPSQLSGGMAQRVALARALARKPRLLLADEPFSALDAITRADMQRLLLQLVEQQHLAVLLVTHDLDEALALGDRILLLGPVAGGCHGVVSQWILPNRADTTQRLALRPELQSALANTLPSAQVSSSSSPLVVATHQPALHLS